MVVVAVLVDETVAKDGLNVFRRLVSLCNWFPSSSASSMIFALGGLVVVVAVVVLFCASWSSSLQITLTGDPLRSEEESRVT